MVNFVNNVRTGRSIERDNFSAMYLSNGDIMNPAFFYISLASKNEENNTNFPLKNFFTTFYVMICDFSNKNLIHTNGKLLRMKRMSVRINCYSTPTLNK